MNKLIGFAFASMVLCSLPTVSMAHGDDFSFSVDGPVVGFGATFPVQGPVPGPQDFRWVNELQNQPLPPSAIAGGAENGQPLFICHAPYNGGVHPGKVVNGACHISWGGNEIVMPEYEALAGSYPFHWVKQYDGNVPDSAVRGGFENGHPLFICQAKYKGNVEIGKVVGDGCNFPYGGAEVIKSPFKVMVF